MMLTSMPAQIREELSKCPECDYQQTKTWTVGLTPMRHVYVDGNQEEARVIQ